MRRYRFTLAHEPALELGARDERLAHAMLAALRPEAIVVRVDRLNEIDDVVSMGEILGRERGPM